MTVYTVIAYGKTVYTEILDAIFSTKSAAEEHAEIIQNHLNKSGIVYDVRVEKHTVDEAVRKE